MSAGDIDDHLAPAGELDHLLRSHTDLREYLDQAQHFHIDRYHDIPFGAGISEDGRRFFIDQHLHIRFRGQNISRVLTRHEAVEWALRRFAQIGLDYQNDSRGHELANRAEFEALAELFPGEDPQALWAAYGRFVDPQIRRDEHESIRRVPYDLAMYPYEGTPMEKTLSDRQDERLRATGERMAAEEERQLNAQRELRHKRERRR